MLADGGLDADLHLAPHGMAPHLQLGHDSGGHVLVLGGAPEGLNRHGAGLLPLDLLFSAPPLDLSEPAHILLPIVTQHLL